MKWRKRALSSTPAMPTTLFVGKAGEFLQRPDHGIERVGDADDKGIRGVFGDARADLLHDLEIDFQKVIAAHAGLARHAGGDDHDIGAFDVLVFGRALESGVIAFDRCGLGQVERLALGHAVNDVEQHHVAELLQRDQMRQRATDLTGTDKGDFLTRHEQKFPYR